jgi:hypothetical protein
MGSASGLPYRTKLEVKKAPLYLPQNTAKGFYPTNAARRFC